MSFPCYAGKFDLECDKPSPALAVANGIFVPGGGWFYLAMKQHPKSGDAQANLVYNDVDIGLAFVVATIMSIGIFANGIRQNNSTQTWVGSGLLFTVKWADVVSASTAAARREREYLNRP